MPLYKSKFIIIFAPSRYFIMITEKLMMPYVFATQHKIVHFTMMVSMLLIYNLQDENLDADYLEYDFSDIFRFDDAPNEITILRAFWIMFFVHALCITLELTIDLIQNKWEHKSDFRASGTPFKE